MRESIGTSFLLNFIVVFIVFIMAFLAATLSYYKAYRINNMILNSIEKFEGYNDFSLDVIQNKLTSMGYQRDGIKCSTTRYEKNGNTTGRLVNNGKEGYCIYRYWDEVPDKNDIFYSFGIVSYMRMEIPIFGGLIKMPVYSRTYNMYYFPGSAANTSNF